MFTGESFNIRNQFLSSTYETPEDLDLFQLFYNGTGLPDSAGEEERQAVAGALGNDPGTDLTKCPAKEINQILLSNTNRTLAEFNGVGLENFTYLAEYDAYYHFHGDTNYWNNVHIVSGERKDGLICLYYEDTFMPNGWKCVTLRNTPSGEYLFVSNTPCERAAVPTAYPAGEPWMTIPLDGLSPYEPQALEVERRGPEDADRILYRFSVEETGVYDPEAETVTDARRLVLYQSVDGAIRAAVENQTLDLSLIHI